MTRTLIASSEHFALKAPFRISRGVKDAADVVSVELRAGGVAGRGECVPYLRYGETPESVLQKIESVRGLIEAGGDRGALQAALPAGAARNALDCALWDLEAKQAGVGAARLAGVPEATAPIITAVTISLDEPARMAAAAAVLAAPLLKVKVNAQAPLAAVEAVRKSAPKARLIVDPNESWPVELLREILPALAALEVALIEQPLPAASDDALAQIDPVVPICADESAHTSADLARLAGRYQAVNIKLDKTGGLTEALRMKAQARALGLQLMIGCMVSSSLSIAPALLLAQDADFVDLDGPWWLKQDRAAAVAIEDGVLSRGASRWGLPA